MDEQTAKAAFIRCVEAATGFEATRAWEEAGRSWVEAARVAVDGGAVPSARQALAQAGEAFRRDDRLPEGARALRLALSYGPDPVEAVLFQVRLAGLETELGLAADALDRLARAWDAAPPPLAPVVLDTWIGVLLGHGTKEGARPKVLALAALGGAGAVAATFRRAQLARLDGALGLARAALSEVIAALAPLPEAAAGIAGARMELAELELLEGRPLAAVAACEEAAREHAGAGRRALALRAEAGRARAATEAGLLVFPGPLRAGLDYARDRGLPVLRLELELAVGTVLAGSDPGQARTFLDAAIGAADAFGIPLSAGRGRLVAAGLAAGEERRALLTRAARDLADHVPLRTRVEALLAEGP